MKTYKTQKEIKKDIKNEELFVNGDVEFECSFKIDASLKINGNIYANSYNINVYDIDAYDVIANDIKASDIKVWNIIANDIKANNIIANDIDVSDIKANDIKANNIIANDIKYYAFCCVYDGIKCSSIKTIRHKALEPICLDGKLEIEEKVEELTIEEVCKLLGKTIKIKK